jgi:hypothetical protein
MMIVRERTEEPTVKEIISTASVLEGLQMIRPFIEKALKEYEDLAKTHQTYLNQLLLEKNAPKERIEYQQEGVRYSQASAVILERLLIPLDGLSEAINNYHKVRGAASKIEI